MTKSERRAGNKVLAEELRMAGIVPSGEAWAAAQAGERDPAVLAGLNRADGLAAKRLPDGTMLPAAIRVGDYLPAHGAKVTGAPMVDPVTGHLWVALAGGQDLELAPGEPVEIRRDRVAPEWVQVAAEDYRHARHAWEAGAESGRPAPTSVPGHSGSSVAMYQLERADYVAACPPPRFADYLKDHAERRREPDQVVSV